MMDYQSFKDVVVEKILDFMAMLGQAKQKGLTDAELIDIISCGFDIEEMAQAIDIVLMEKSY